MKGGDAGDIDTPFSLWLELDIILHIYLFSRLFWILREDGLRDGWEKKPHFTPWKTYILCLFVVVPLPRLLQERLAMQLTIIFNKPLKSKILSNTEQILEAVVPLIFQLTLCPL